MVAAMGMGMKKACSYITVYLTFCIFFSGLITHSILGHPDFYQSLLLAIGAFAGGMFGARLSLEVKEKNLQIIVSIALIAATIKLFIDAVGNF